MKTANFVHLHVHSDYSALNSVIRIPALVRLAAEMKMPALALTDHGNLFGALHFYGAALNAGIKPIIGAELYVAVKGMASREKDERSPYHLVVLCRNEEGYNNLCKLLSVSWLEGFYYKPRIDRGLLEKYGTGLVGLSGCLSGEIPRLLLSDDDKAFEEKLEWHQSVFGEENFYLELQSTGLPGQDKVNAGLIDIAQLTGAPLVCTNNCHYLQPDEAYLQRVVDHINWNKRIDEQDLSPAKTGQLYFRSDEEMEQIFSAWPEALHNTLEIAEKCNFQFDLSKLHLPDACPDERGTIMDKLRGKARRGLAERLPFFKQKGPLFTAKTREYKRRLEHELKSIEKAGTASYFLIAQDAVQYARQKDIPVGPGRGAAPGSLVNFAVGITRPDPIEHGLIFERFHPRSSSKTPDIFIDFCQDRWQEILEHLRAKYGRDQVAYLTDFRFLRLRGAVRHLGPLMGLDLKLVDQVAGLIPWCAGELQCALDQEPRLKAIVDSEPKMDELLKISSRIDGLFYAPAQYPSGIVVADKPIIEFLPFFKSSAKNDPIQTQFDCEAAKNLGLATYQFLGLQTISALDRCLKLIREKHGIEINLDAIPLTDQKVWQLLAAADTDGVFFMEPEGVKKRLPRLRPENLGHLTAMHALWRPWPIEAGIFDSYISRKRGEEPIAQICSAYGKLVKETFGLILYSEQVMMVAHELAGYPMDKAYAFFRQILLRNSKLRSEFIKGCTRHKIPKAQAGSVFNEIERLGPHSFMKSHALCYALLSYQTAWLKANYPQEFSTTLVRTRQGENV